MNCKCGNCQFGFECMVKWSEEHPGDVPYSCEFCGIYTAGEPRCNHCEEEK